MLTVWCAAVALAEPRRIVTNSSQCGEYHGFCSIKQLLTKLETRTETFSVPWTLNYMLEPVQQLNYNEPFMHGATVDFR